MVRTPEDAALHHRIRHEVFVAEQGIFADSDVDHHDGDPATIRVLGLVGAVAAGTVRLYPLDATGRWQGDRLAVLPGFREHRLGVPLVRFAVATAGGLGGREMVAHVQVDNVRFFQRLGWHSRGEAEIYVGRPHRLMVIELGGEKT